MKRKKRLPLRREFEEMKELKEEINKELEKEWKKEEREEGFEERKKALSYEHELSHRAHIKETFIKKQHRGRVRGKPSHIRRNRHGRMSEKTRPE